MQARAKNKKTADTTQQVLGDSRFAQMFEDTEYAIDKHSEAYKQLRPTEGKVRVESDDEAGADSEEEVKPQGKDLNRIFAGRDAEESGSDQDSE